MSYSVDVNVLLYASDDDSPWHHAATAFLNRCVSRPELFCLAWPTLMGYLRISTHPRIFHRPLTPPEAEGNVEALLGLPRVRVVGEQDDFWAVYSRLAREQPLRGNMVPDAHLAAILLENGVSVLYTRDRDFLKYPSLKVRDPFTS